MLHARCTSGVTTYKSTLIASVGGYASRMFSIHVIHLSCVCGYGGYNIKS